VGTPVPFQRCLLFIIATANKEFTLTAGKFVPVCKKTMMNVRTLKFASCDGAHTREDARNSTGRHQTIRFLLLLVI
jgi:hypothetical protein